MDDAAELAALKERATAADMALLDEGATTCCFTPAAKSALDHRPPGRGGEHFHTLENIPVFNEAAAVPRRLHPKQPLHPGGHPHGPRAAAVKSSSSQCTADLRPRMTESTTPLNVLFCAPNNSARSILAEALLNAMGERALQGSFRWQQPNVTTSSPIR